MNLSLKWLTIVSAVIFDRLFYIGLSMPSILKTAIA
jgi:hypothetical protein